MNNIIKTVCLCLLAASVLANGFQSTPMGALYRDMKAGSGEVAATGDVATIHFTGWLEQAGKQGREFFNTRSHGNPVSFVVGTDRVIAGWNEGVVGMRAGGKRLLKLPPSLAYGSRGVDDMVPPDAPLVLIIELLVLEKLP